MMRTEIGKITSISFGLGGYQGATLGLHVTLSSSGWGVGDSKSSWDYETIKHSEHCKWTEEERDLKMIEVCKLVSHLLKEAKVQSVEELKGKPIAADFEGMTLKSWRILTEVL